MKLVTRKPLLEKMTSEDIEIIVPIIIKMFKLKSNKDTILKTKNIVTFINTKKKILGFKTAFNSQRLQKVVNYIRTNSLLPIISTSTGYYYSFDRQDILEMILNFESRIEAMVLAKEGLRYIITQEKVKELEKDLLWNML